MRDLKHCRDFFIGDCLIKEIKSPKYGTFNLLINEEDSDLIEKGLSVHARRGRGGKINISPVASKNGYYRNSADMRFVHLLIVERIIGRKLKKNELIYHINGNHFDSRRCNLLLLKNSEHAKLHMDMGTMFAQKFFQSPLNGESLQLLEKLLTRNTQNIQGISKVI